MTVGRNISATEIYHRMHTGSSSYVSYYEGERTAHSGWNHVAKYNPWYWLGARMWRWTWDDWSIGGEYDRVCEYATFEQCARKTLEETYGDRREQG